MGASLSLQAMGQMIGGCCEHMLCKTLGLLESMLLTGTPACCAGWLEACVLQLPLDVAFSAPILYSSVVVVAAWHCSMTADQLFSSKAEIASK